LYDRAVNIQPALTAVLLVFGAGFLLADARLLAEYLRFRKRRRGALLTWRSASPPYYVMALSIGVVLGCLVFYKVVVLRRQVFGEGMMFLYYAYLLPLNQNIRRGFYEDGIWADSEFIRYDEVGGVSWREGEHDITLIIISRLKNLARRLSVPGDKYGAARRLLRDKIGEHKINFLGSGLDLGQHDDRDAV
jgi:hypothetical protein